MCKPPPPPATSDKRSLIPVTAPPPKPPPSTSTMLTAQWRATHSVAPSGPHRPPGPPGALLPPGHGSLSLSLSLSLPLSFIVRQLSLSLCRWSVSVSLSGHCLPPPDPHPPRHLAHWARTAAVCRHAPSYHLKKKKVDEGLCKIWFGGPNSGRVSHVCVCVCVPHAGPRVKRLPFERYQQQSTFHKPDTLSSPPAAPPRYPPAAPHSPPSHLPRSLRRRETQSLWMRRRSLVL